MPATWDSVASNPQFLAMHPDQQDAARQQYFQDVVAPQVPADHLDAARQQFDATTAIKGAAPPAQIGAAEDVAKSIGSNLVGGGLDLAMSLPNMINQAVAGPQYLGRGVAENVDKLIGIDPQPRGDIWQPFYSSGDVENAIGTSYEPKTTAGKVVALPARIVGGIGTAGAMKSPKAAEFLKTQDSGVSTGLASGGATTAIESAGQGAKNIAKGIVARSPDKLDEVSASIKATASNDYKNMRASGAVLSPQALGNTVKAVETDVAKTGPLQKTLHSGYLGVMKDFKAAAKGGDMGLEEMDQYRQLFRDVVERNTDKGRLNGDAMKAQTAIKAIDNSVNRFGSTDIVGGNTDAVQHLLSGRANWAKASRFEAISDIVRRSGGNINKLKADIFKFANNKNNIRGWQPNEIAALKAAAKNSTGESVLKAFGTLGFDIMKPVSGGSNVIPALEATAAMAQAPYAAPMLAGGTAAKTTQGFIGRGKVENLLNTLQNRK